ncbi:hypothetical protein PPOLYM_02259 [Paenibacillus polymyxa]|jgi:hypothetical protein|uniref:Uncharacterized protein n=1 Tax=Paenibacillus peoriae TaxID=59893 RepID=A0ABU1QA94_9BACL|nr:hypothetical protein [Paenibacillus sp. PvR133]MDR6776560.1 hypothetical protein [Paenibacillus peoriae]SFR06929.1 hypothetical protein SAMN04488603_102258 [Paenibacillus sp. cl130]VUG05866.1 hypothetical protein PPOLYM_02259 [Paenibacillus polymyxa]
MNDFQFQLDNLKFSSIIVISLLSVVVLPRERVGIVIELLLDRQAL